MRRYPVDRVPFGHETIVSGAPTDCYRHIPIGDPGCPRGRVAHSAQRCGCPHATEICNPACQCCDRTNIAPECIMVHKCALRAILGVGNRDGSAVCRCTGAVTVILLASCWCLCQCCCHEGVVAVIVRCHCQRCACSVAVITQSSRFVNLVLGVLPSSC